MAQPCNAPQGHKDWGSDHRKMCPAHGDPAFRAAAGGAAAMSAAPPSLAPDAAAELRPLPHERDAKELDAQIRDAVQRNPEALVAYVKTALAQLHGDCDDDYYDHTAAIESLETLREGLGLRGGDDEADHRAWAALAHSMGHSNDFEDDFNREPPKAGDFDAEDVEVMVLRDGEEYSVRAFAVGDEWPVDYIPGLEVNVEIDPDGGTDVSATLDGEPFELRHTVIDPGAGWTEHEWGEFASSETRKSKGWSYPFAEALEKELDLHASRARYLPTYGQPH